MPKKKAEWKDDTTRISELSLDLQNPRIPRHVKEREDEGLIRNYLLEKEDVLRIAKSIANNGYHKSAVAIACKENEKLVVLDGNRRLAACQFLLNPKLAPKAGDRKRLEELNKLLDKKELEDVKITIAPSRKAAEKEIWDIHVNTKLLRPWEVLQRLRMLRSLIDLGDYDIGVASQEYGVSTTDFKKELGKLFFYDQILEYVNSKEEEELLKSGFNGIERLILSKNGKKLLGYSIDKNGNVTFRNKRGAISKLKKLVPYIVGEDKIPAQATQKWLKENVFSKLDPSKFSKSKSASKKKSVDLAGSKKLDTTPSPPSVLRLISRQSSRNYPGDEAGKIVEYVLNHINIVAEQLLDRHDNRSTLKIENEFDVQDLLHALLSMFFDDVQPEAWNLSTGVSPSRTDFLLLDNGTMIEVKTTLTMRGDDKAIRKKLEKDLHDDVMKYTDQHKDCKRIYLFVYDPKKNIKKHTTFERGLTRKVNEINISAIVNRG